MNEAIEKAKVLLVDGKAKEAYSMVIRKFKDATESKDSKQGGEEGGTDNRVFQPAYYFLGECLLETDEVGNIAKAKEFLVSAFWKRLKSGEKN